MARTPIIRRSRTLADGLPAADWRFSSSRMYSANARTSSCLVLGASSPAAGLIDHSGWDCLSLTGSCGGSVSGSAASGAAPDEPAPLPTGLGGICMPPRHSPHDSENDSLHLRVYLPARLLRGTLRLCLLWLLPR